ncbi:hypothetical protein SEA_RALEIGH_27 [Streptomyces phage Raleigh]|uniref:Uncharacterized protein n=1 Tax=Streptomyces phage Raleigh TaxID=1920312 RepID=A0A1J0MCS0_9CAUD|nr:hypothetical protein [Streptomyces sp. MMBL 11-1]YP_009788286.1 hypothetical protein HOR46_gp27 [Streptomyces phage Raleigh]APD18776.1 hypothetical protein SEA_RALEIGH_27 [Streptomyces phage Raleigh]
MTTEPALSFRAVPGPGFAAGCTVSTWVDVGGLSTPVAYILIGHAPPRRPGESAESVEAGLMGMVDSMRLRPAAERVPIVGPRLLLRDRFAALDYGHPTFVLRLPATGDDWRRHVVAGGPVCVTIGLDPLPPGAGPDAVDAYLSRVAATGRAYMGATTRRVR